MASQKIDALLLGTDPTYGLVFRDHIVELAAKYRLPTVYDSRDFVEHGGLITYSSVLTDTWRQAGLYVGRFSGAVAFLLLANLFSTTVALRYAILLIAGLQMFSILVARTIVTRGRDLASGPIDDREALRADDALATHPS